MIKHFLLFPFLCGLVLGIVGIYFIKPETTVVFKYPTPTNAGTLAYKDKNNVCYKYGSKEVSCDAKDVVLKNYPLN
jgi:hypothetical protein